MYERHAGFHQSAREQARLPKVVPAVPVAKFGRLASEIEGRSRLWRTQEVKRLHLVLPEGRARAARGNLVVESLQQVATFAQPIDGHIRRQGEFGNAEVGRARLAAEQPRIGRTTEKAGVLTRPDRLVGVEDVHRQ